MEWLAIEAEMVRKQRAHFQAARRLRKGMIDFPGARVGLEKLAAHHLAEAANIAVQLCSRQRLQAQTGDDLAVAAAGR